MRKILALFVALCKALSAGARARQKEAEAEIARVAAIRERKD